MDVGSFLLANTQDRVEQGSEQTDPIKDVHAHCRITRMDETFLKLKIFCNTMISSLALYLV